MAKMTKEDFESKGYLFAAYTEDPFDFIGFFYEPMRNKKTGKSVIVLHYTFGEYVDGSDWKTIDYPIFTEEECDKAVARSSKHNIFCWYDEDGDEKYHIITNLEFADKVYDLFEEFDSKYHYAD